MKHNYVKAIACLCMIMAAWLHKPVQAQCVQIVCMPDTVVSNDSAQCGAVVNFSAPLAVDLCAVVTDTFQYTGTMQQFVVPPGVTQLSIEVRGAQGGSGVTGPGGLGALMQGDFTVSPGDVLDILVGQQGQDNPIDPSHLGRSPGGGGGSFVVQGANPLIIAGGGGGSGNISVGTGGTTGTSGLSSTGPTVGTGGTGGNGGAPDAGFNGGGSGGGLLTDGGAPAGDGGTSPNRGGKSFLSGGAGGDNFQHSGAGGYGGGGGGGNYGCGGGGGYSGGGGGCSNGYGGGGGGSFNAGTNQTNTGSFQAGNGLVVIAYSNGQLTPVQIAGLPSGSVFPVGVTTQTFVAVSNLQSDTCSFTITVQDTVNPFVTAPGDFTSCDPMLQGITLLSGDNCSIGTSTYALSGATTGSGNGDANGVNLNPGVTQVIYAVADGDGNTATDTLVVTILDCSSIEESLAGQPQVYPNPAGEVISIDLQVHVPQTEVSLMDVQGKMIRTGSYTNQQVINFPLDQVVPGMYWIVMKAGTEEWRHKIVKY